jgi:glutamine synthetase
MFISAEYIWIDGDQPTKKLRSKTRILESSTKGVTQLADLPEWGFDGSSTYQASGHNSDLVLKPIALFKDPLRGPGNVLVMCEVFDDDNCAVPSNTRSMLRNILQEGGDSHGIWIGFEQEYTFFQENRPLGWPVNGFPKPQGPYYCGVGADKIFGRSIVEEHAKACLDSGIMIYGINGEVMPGQWEFQIGYRGCNTESPDPLTVSDHLWVARWLLGRVAENYNVSVSLENKPVKGDWNGAGTHTNFSSKSMRNPSTGKEEIHNFIEELQRHHNEHIDVYGYGLAERLTGHHETCDIKTFRAGPRDRGASIRIPNSVAALGYGYIEDRRPGANCDPYEVSARLVKTYMLAQTKNETHKKTLSRASVHA